jgi:glycosyltransferase involved in cell wall biosynthesis
VKNMQDLSVAAIIPLYNGARWIEQSIRSVFAQRLQPDEFIVVDDGSTDDGPAVVERLAQEHPITLLRKPNGGQSSARNFGVACSKSALIALLDQDDFWHPDHLEELRRPFEADHRGVIGWVYSDLDRIDEAGNLFCRKFLSTLGNDHPKRHVWECLRQDMFVLPSASLISRKAFEAVGGFDERLSGYEDDDLFLRLFRASWENVYVEKSLSTWRIFEASASYTIRMSKSRMIYLEKLIKSFPNEPRLGIFYGRDLIAPRFVKILIADTFVASREPDWPRVRRNILDLYVAAAKLPPARRIVVRALAFILGIYPLTRPLLISVHIARPILSRTYRAIFA